MADLWVKQFRAQLRSVTGPGWSARADRHGKARLVVTRPGEPTQTIGIDPDFTKAQSAKILAIAEELFQLMRDRGIDLRTANRVLFQQDAGSASSWAEAAEGFKERMAANVVPATWKKYQEVIDMGLKVMDSRRPAASGAELIEAVVKKWTPGSRRRQQAVQQLSRFLKYRVEMNRLPDCWLAPSDTTELVGHAHSALKKETPLRSNKVTELEDREILSLLDSLPETETGERWRFAIKLLAELGLRPHELNFLEVRKDNDGTPYWWCSYEKRAGKKHKTSQRRVDAFPIPGTNWNLIELWQITPKADRLPPLTAGNGAGDSFRQYLRRQGGWKMLESIYASKGQNIGSYSFRNSYCLRCNMAGVPVAAVASSMGNTPDVLMAKYSWSNHASQASAFNLARAEQARTTAAAGV